MAKVLIIDDEPAIRRAMRSILENEGYVIADAPSAVEALPLLNKEVYDAIFCDIKMPQMDGIEFLEKARALTDTPVIIISGHGTIDIAVEAIKKGAYDFIEKPMDLNRMLITLRNALDKNQLVNETKLLRNAVSKHYEMVGDSPAMNGLYDMIERVAPTNARVLITGENGTGKELVARQLHELSPRKGNAFIEVNCAAIPSELIESQLFGHEKGAFTSAVKQKKGDFELADNGTLFLDEIGDMSLAAQAKVLRALQENKITRVGGEEEIKVDVRVIAATNKNLQDEIAKGNFREDLYHRISMIIMKVPPLRERLDDIPLLINSFVVKSANEMGKPIPTFTESAIEELKKQPWTGNIRELQNVVGRLVILCGPTISAEDVKKYL
ncbi:MAG: sigma-54 dependent transcriptional regulator [Bacteroidales bacterium]|nr:sigma-54 dependent transcriptional regulator [Bacteroidales bacterium]